MEAFEVLFLTFAFLVATALCDANNGSVLGRPQAPNKRLFDDLMSKYGSTRIRPVRNNNEAVEVMMFYKPGILSEFNEQIQQLSVTGSLHMTWIDEFLVWDPEEYGGVERISLRASDIWFPDITAYERLDVKEAYVNIFEPYAIVDSTGSVEYYQLTDLTVYCRLDMTLFPFDTQKCTISFTSYSYDSAQLALAFINSTDGYENRFQPNGVWQLERFEVHEIHKQYLCCPNPFVEIHYIFFLTRIGSFYVYSIWIPSGLLSTMIIAVFVMHPNSGEKVTLSVSNVLAFVLFQQIVVESMPRSGDDSPVIVVFFSAMIAISCLSVLASAVVLRVYYHDPRKPVPRMLMCLVARQKRNRWKRRYTMVTTNNNRTRPRDPANHPSEAKPGFEEMVLSDITDGTAGEKEATAPPPPEDQRGRRNSNSASNQEDTDWMILALVMDKFFLVIAVCAMLGTVLYCGIKYWVLFGVH